MTVFVGVYGLMVGRLPFMPALMLLSVFIHFASMGVARYSKCLLSKMGPGMRTRGMNRQFLGPVFAIACARGYWLVGCV